MMQASFRTHEDSLGSVSECSVLDSRGGYARTLQAPTIWSGWGGTQHEAPGGYSEPPGSGTCTDSLQTAVRRPLNKLMTRTAKATMSSRWIRAPPKCRLKPKSHKIRRTTKIVQSMSTSYVHSRATNLLTQACARKPVRANG